MGNNSNSNIVYNGLTQEQFDRIARKLEFYINNRGVKLEEELTPEELEWLKQQAVDSETDPEIHNDSFFDIPFIRFEQIEGWDNSPMAPPPSSLYIEGELIPTTKEIQSYTRNARIQDYIQNGSGNLVLIIPEGNVKHINPYKILEAHGGYEDTIEKYSGEQESLVIQTNQRITEVESYNNLKDADLSYGFGDENEDFNRLLLEYGEPSKYLNSVTIVHTKAD